MGKVLNKLSLTLVVAAFLLLTTVGAIVITQSSNQSGSNIEENKRSTPTASASPTIASSPTPIPTSTPTPTPTITSTTVPAAEGSFGPKGYFRITSPTRTTYDSGNLTLTITGEAINQPLSMAYSIDGQDKVPFSAVVRQEHD